MGFRLAPFAVGSLLVLLGASAALAGNDPKPKPKKEADEPAVQIDYSEKAAEAIPVGGVGRLEDVPDQLRAPTGDNIYGYQNVERAGVQQRYNHLPKVANVLGIKEATGGLASSGAGTKGAAGVRIAAGAVAAPAALTGGAPPAVGVPIGGRVEVAKAAATAVTPAERSSQLGRESKQLLAMRSWQEAAAKATEALGSDGNNAAAQIVLSNARRKLGDCRGAETHARSAVELEPLNAEARKALARALSCQGRKQDALAVSEQATHFAPKDANGWALHASLQDAAGRQFEARRALQQAADLDPRYQRILETSADGKTPIRDPDIDEDILEQDRLTARRGGGGTAVAVVLGTFGAVGAGLGVLAWRRHRRWEEAMRPVAPPEPKGPPRLADKYEVVRVLAQNAGGDYLEARDRRLGRTVAVRRVPLTGDPSQRADVVGRAKTTASLRHPGLLDVYEVLDEGDFVYVVFEWIRGRTAGQNLTGGGRMGLEEAIEALEPVCEAVAFSHSQGVSRGRIGPECIVFTDLGVSKLADLDAKSGADEAAKEADVRALGTCLYQLVTGTRPSAAGVAPSGGAAGLPPALDALVAEAISPEAGAAPMSAGQFLQRLRALRPAPVSAGAPAEDA